MPRKRTSSKHRSLKRAYAYKRLPPWLWAALATIAILAIVAILFVSCQSVSEEMSYEINTMQAYEKYQNGAFFLDVRTPEEWDNVRIPKTTFIKERRKTPRGEPSG